jgi:hypothetical protein
MALINGIIPVQNYETIRDAIGAILYTEIPNQEALTGNSYVSSYFSERFVNPDETDFPCLNIVFAGGDYDNKDQTRVDGYYTYHIAAYTSASSTANDDGDHISTLKLHRVLGLCRAILMNPVYNNLGFVVKVIKSTIVSQITIAKNDTFADAANSIMGYIEFKVKCIEDVLLKDPIPLASSLTVVKLYLTDKGYRYGPDGGELDFLISELSTDNSPIYLIGE